MKSILALAFGLAMVTHAFAAENCMPLKDVITKFKDKMPEADVKAMADEVVPGFVERLNRIPAFADVDPKSIIVITLPGAPNVGLDLRLDHCMSMVIAVPVETYRDMLPGNKI